MTKADQDAADAAQEAYEKQREKDGTEIHLPRGPVNPATGKVDSPDSGKKKPADK